MPSKYNANKVNMDSKIPRAVMSRNVAAHNNAARVLTARSRLKQRIDSATGMLKPKWRKGVDVEPRFVQHKDKPKIDFQPNDVRHSSQVHLNEKSKFPKKATEEMRNKLHGGDAFSARAAGIASAIDFVHKKIKGEEKDPPREEYKLHPATVATHVAEVTHPIRTVTETDVKTGSVYGAPVALANKLGYKGPVMHSMQIGRYRHKNGRMVTVIVNHEPMGPLNGSQSFVSTGFPLNPGNTVMFQWLSIIAPAFDMYLFTKHSIEYRTELSTGFLGRVGLAYDYENTDSLPINRTAAELQKGCVADVAWKNAQAKMRLAASTHQKFYFINPGNANNGGDVRVTTQCRAQIFTVDCSKTDGTTAFTGVIGEIWNRYEVHLMEATSSVVTNPSAPAAPAVVVSAGVAVSGSVMASSMGAIITNVPTISSSVALTYDSTVAAVPGSNPGLVANINWGGTGTALFCRFNIPTTPNGNGYQCSPGSWLVVLRLAIGANASNSWTNPVFSGTGVSAHTTTYNNFNGAINFGSIGGATVTNDFYVVRVDSTGLTSTIFPSVLLQYNSALSQYNSVFCTVINLASSPTILGDPVMQITRDDGKDVVQCNRYKKYGFDEKKQSMFEVEFNRVPKSSISDSIIDTRPLNDNKDYKEDRRRPAEKAVRSRSVGPRTGLIEIDHSDEKTLPPETRFIDSTPSKALWDIQTGRSTPVTVIGATSVKSGTSKPLAGAQPVVVYKDLSTDESPRNEQRDM